jgi:hypothetical protein
MVWLKTKTARISWRKANDTLTTPLRRASRFSERLADSRGWKILIGKKPRPGPSQESAGEIKSRGRGKACGDAHKTHRVPRIPLNQGFVGRVPAAADVCSVDPDGRVVGVLFRQGIIISASFSDHGAGSAR